MKNNPPFLVLSFFLAITLCASKCKKNTPSELEKLPPATQTGAKTFGCLVNGQAFIPDNGCTFLCSPAFAPYYENINGGLFSFTATLRTNGIDKVINLGIDTCISIGSYNFTTGNSKRRIGYNDYKNINGCETIYSNDAGVVTVGILELSRFDLTNRVFSGTFEFTLSKAGCETIKITNGRFDAKL